MHEAGTVEKIVFELIHFKIGKDEHGDPENDQLDFKGIGTYRSQSSAEAAVGRLRCLPGFRKWPDGFRIYPVVLDRVGWPDGFTEAEADRSYWNWPSEEILPG